MLVCTNKGCARTGEQTGWAYYVGLAEKGVGAKEEEEEGQCADHRRGQQERKGAAVVAREGEG